MEQVKELSGKNPLNTVMIRITNMPPNDSIMYQDRIKRIFDCCDTKNVVFTEDTK